MTHSLSQKLIARHFAVLLIASGIVSALVHTLPNPTQMSTADRSTITLVCLACGAVIWSAPWNQWPRRSLYALPPIGLGLKMWANLLGGLGPYSYSIHFVLIFVWIGVALPQRASLICSPLLAAAYALPLWVRGDPSQASSVAMVVPICIVIGESVGWISNRLRSAEEANGERLAWSTWLVEASLELAHQQDLGPLAMRVAELANELPTAMGIVILLPETNRKLKLAASAGWPSSLPAEFVLEESAGLLHVMKTNALLEPDDERAIALAQHLKVPGIRVVPLSGSRRCVGIVLIARPDNSRQFDPFLRSIGRSLALQAGLAVERMRDREALKDASLHDALTGLGNRRKADERLLHLEPRDGLIMIDLDHFKQINDEEGHAAGDAALKSLGEFLVDSLREGDEAFRVGGEEFLVVLSASGEKALLAAERLCDKWQSLRPLTTFSAGVSVHEAGRDAATTLALADAALYRAKAGGRGFALLES